MWRSAGTAGGQACSGERRRLGGSGLGCLMPPGRRCFGAGHGASVGHLARACKPTVPPEPQKNVQLTRCGGRCMIMQPGIPDSCRRCPTSALSTQHSALRLVDATGTSCRPPSPRHFQTEKQLTAPAGRPVRDPAHALALTPAVAFRGAGSVRRQTGMRTARALPGDRNRPLPTAGVAGHSDALLGRAPYMRIPSDVYCRPETGSFRQASGRPPCGQNSQKRGSR